MTDQQELTHEEALELFGAPVEAIEPDSGELELSLVLNRIRALLMHAANHEGVGVNELATRLGVSPSVVSRLFRSESDMRVSTAVEWAHALGYVWDFNLRNASCGTVGSNHASATIQNTATTTSSVGCTMVYDFTDQLKAKFVETAPVAIAPV
jgi:hypothetical protein